MRLSHEDLSKIRSCFRKRFDYGDQLWLFGSRLDDTKRGGDIDLYIETKTPTLAAALRQKHDFLADLYGALESQRIDVVPTS